MEVIMKFIKQISLLALLSFGASAIAPVVQVQAVPSAGMLSKLTLESWSSWVKDFKFEIKPYSLAEIIEAYPKTAAVAVALATIGAFKFQKYYWKKLTNIRENMRDAIERAQWSADPNLNKEYLLANQHCCNLFEFMYFLKWKISRAELIGGEKLERAIKEFYDQRNKVSKKVLDMSAMVKFIKLAIGGDPDAVDYIIED